MPPTPEPIPTPELLDGRTLFVRTAVGIGLLLVGMAAIGVWIREPAIRASRTFIDTLGGPGVFIGYLLPDAFPIPIPHEIFTSMALVAGMNFWIACAWAFAGSLTGACIAYWLGRSLHRLQPIGNLLERHGGQIGLGIDRYGTTVVAVGALTPLPFGLICWMSGAGRMPFGRFFAVCQLRAVRVVVYTGLAWAGIITFIN